MRVIAASLPRPSVDVLGPLVVMARALGQARNSSPQAFVARPAEARHLAPARLYRYRAHPRSGCEGLIGRVASSLVAYVGHQACCGERTLGAHKQREEDLPIGVGAHRACDPLFQSLYPL